MNRQVKPGHYDFGTYVTRERWNSNWHQINEVLLNKPQRVLIVGVGDNLVATVIKSKCVEVKTFDFDQELSCDYVGDVRDIASIVPLKEYDVVTCCQVLEHIPFDFFESTVRGLIKVAKKTVIVSLPYSHRKIFYLSTKLPKIPHITCEITMPLFWKKWKFDGEHYWEVGAKNYSKKRIDQIISKVASIRTCYFASANKYHLFYVIDCSGGR